MTLRSDAEFEGKLTCGLANFYQSARKSQN